MESIIYFIKLVLIVTTTLVFVTGTFIEIGERYSKKRKFTLKQNYLYPFMLYYIVGFVIILIGIVVQLLIF